MDDRTPECCKNCQWRKPDGGCKSKGVFCTLWLEWFYASWAGIQEAARRLKEKAREEASRNGEK